MYIVSMVLNGYYENENDYWNVNTKDIDSKGGNELNFLTDMPDNSTKGGSGCLPEDCLSVMGIPHEF